MSKYPKPAKAYSGVYKPKTPKKPVTGKKA